MELANYGVLYVTFVLKLALTDYHDSQIKYYYGWVQSGLIAGLLIANIVNLIIAAKHDFKIYRHKKRC